MLSGSRIGLCQFPQGGKRLVEVGMCAHERADKFRNLDRQDSTLNEPVDLRSDVNAL